MTARILIGVETADHLSVLPLRRPYPNAEHASDRDFIEVQVSVEAGAFRGRFHAGVFGREIATFRDELQRLYVDLREARELDTAEGWLTLEIKGDGNGHFRTRGVVRDDPALANELHFVIDFDQTHVPRIVRDLDELLAAYPPMW